jgi:hypothetical protein
MWTRPLIPWLLPLALASVGCGGRSLLDDFGHGARRDAAVDVGDGGVDGGGPALPLSCRAEPEVTRPGGSVVLTAATEPGASTAGWRLVDGDPRGFTQTGEGFVATVEPLAEGAFVFRLEAVDPVSGRRGSCDVQIFSVQGPPLALCPDAQQVTVDTPLVLQGGGVDDVGVVGFAWALRQRPDGASPRLTGLDQATLLFESSTAGLYRLELTVFDAEMASGSCEVEVFVTGPPEVACPAPSFRQPTRQPLRLSARAVDDVGIVERSWTVLARPDRSTAQPTPANQDATTFTPDRVGAYVLEYRVRDEEGFEVVCPVQVEGLPTPPVVTCPDLVRVDPLERAEVTATAVDDGFGLDWRWELLSQPDGSDARPPSPADAPTTFLGTRLVGDYVLRVTATDDDGLSGTCETTVRAINDNGIRVEMFWDRGASDMDLHLLDPDGTRWSSALDCHFRNCEDEFLSVGAPGTDDDPILDIDNTMGFGPENIRIADPRPGIYRVGVDAWRSGTGGDPRVTVRIYCQDTETEPTETFGPVAMPNNWFWRVADVEILADGSCRITELLGADGRPLLNSDRRTR